MKGLDTMEAILTHSNEQVNTVLAWGRSQPTAHTVASLGEFTPAETDALRRMLRSEYQGRNPAVSGDYRKGYEMSIGNERVGVTNGYGSFKIYYRRSCLNGYGRATAEIPFDGVAPETDDWADDYAIEEARI